MIKTSFKMLLISIIALAVTGCNESGKSSEIDIQEKVSMENDQNKLVKRANVIRITPKDKITTSTTASPAAPIIQKVPPRSLAVDNSITVEVEKVDPSYTDSFISGFNDLKEMTSKTTKLVVDESKKFIDDTSKEIDMIKADIKEMKGNKS